MMWPTWQQAATATVVLSAVSLATHWSRSSKVRTVSAFCQETALVSFLYMLWRLAKYLPLVHDEGAIERGQQIYDLQRWLHLPSELAMERFAMDHHWLAELTVDYYATFHVPTLLIFLLWMWVWHRDQYPRWRDVLAITTGFCLFIRFVRVAPPRLTPGHGFVDLPALLGRDIYGPVGTGVSDQFAAMPSIHIVWAAIVAFGVFSVGRSWWRWIGVVHLALTFWAVMATANHWWLDGLVACALVGIAMVIDDQVRAAVRRRRGGDPTESPPSPPGEPDTPQLVATG